MKLDFDGDDIVYKEVVIAPWLYHDEILYSLDDKCTQNNITNDCGSISEAIRIIDKYRIPKNKTKKHNFEFFASKFKKQFGKDVVYTDFGIFKEIRYETNQCNILAASEHLIDHPNALKNRANGAIVICNPNSTYWNSNANKVFDFPCDDSEYNVIINYIKKMSKDK